MVELVGDDEAAQGVAAGNGAAQRAPVAARAGDQRAPPLDVDPGGVADHDATTIGNIIRTSERRMRASWTL